MSVGASASPASKAQHVPAWKRLGLKLKYAKESADNSPAPILESGSSIKVDEGTLGDDKVDHRPSKKRKTSGDTNDNSHARASEVVNGFDASTMRAGKDQNGLHEEISYPATVRPTSRRKSVTFTPETKVGDGIVSESRDAPRTGTQAVSTRTEVDEPSPASSPKKSKKEKRAKKAASKPGSDSPELTKDLHGRKSKLRLQESSDPNQISSYVEYIQTFHHDRDNWKFNKAKQNDVLKNAMNIHRITPQHSDALLAYLAGLQGIAARQRLVESATVVLKDLAAERGDVIDVDSMETDAARREAYRNALRRHLEQFRNNGLQNSEHDEQQLETMRVKNEQGIRAEAVIEQVLRDDLYPKQREVSHQPSKATDTTSNGTNTAAMKRNKRKSRTQEISSSDSSSSDSSSDDSSDSEDDEKLLVRQKNAPSTPGPRTVSQALKVDPSVQRFQRPSGDVIRRPPKKDIPEAPAYGPSVSGAIPAGFQLNKPKKKIFDDELLDSVFPRK